MLKQEVFVQKEPANMMLFSAGTPQVAFHVGRYCRTATELARLCAFSRF